MPTTRQLNVHYLPQFIAEHELAGSAVVVIDLLRASTTICQALAAGASEVVPFVEIADAWQAAAGGCREEILLGGERGGGRIEGFDLGNSPDEYTPERLFGKRLLFTTTNGTRAMHHARLAERVLIGALVNLSAVVESLADEPRIDLLCAGTAAHVSRDDILAAGAMVSTLVAKGQGGANRGGGEVVPKTDESRQVTGGSYAGQNRAEPHSQLNEAAEAAAREWQELETAARASGRPLMEQVALELRSTPGGKNLLAIGLDDDLASCADIDRLSIVPVLDVAAWRITVQ